MPRVGDSEVSCLEECLRAMSKKHGWRQSLRSLQYIARNPADPDHRVGRMLLNDYQHLKDGGLSPFAAMAVLLMPYGAKR